MHCLKICKKIKEKQVVKNNVENIFKTNAINESTQKLCQSIFNNHVSNQNVHTYVKITSTTVKKN
jgi:hypothetical protein